METPEKPRIRHPIVMCLPELCDGDLIVFQWFGNLMTMEWWDDLWLNEGFASYMEYKGVAHQHPEWNPMTKIITTDLQPVMIADSSINSHPIVQHVVHPDEITEIFDRISYAKGASVLRMLEFFAGEKNFRTGITNFLKKHEYKNAQTSDLWEEISNACGYQGNRSISSIMKTWTEQMGFPYVTIKRRQNSTVFVAKQKRFLKNAAVQRERAESIHKYVWSIPLSYMTSDGKSGIVWIHEAEESKTTFVVKAALALFWGALRHFQPWSDDELAFPLQNSKYRVAMK
ncbi:Glutamyl aminopeptidase [Araneus ventricosus]|uniref:Glutamyl aminopeptidase n=1 Tax=Araneus ventricosus TaxID=182803 RepID=A0A4Y2P0T2_ARAVE|nr:Glutamyl aminopeptidase [Araneus ventricosus]